jgi:hypothetical protein
MRSGMGGLPMKSEVRATVFRLKIGFGDPRDHVSVEQFSLAAGTDIAPILQRFIDDLGGASYWGYVIEGGLSVTHRDGTTATIEPGDVFYVSFGQSVRVEQDCELLMLNGRRTQVEVLAPVQMRMSTYRH